MPTVHVSTPGRVCLFGEHQDYLHLPVIPCAISLRIDIVGRRTPQRVMTIDMPDIHARETIPLETRIPYGSDRDYLRSAVNVMIRHGFTFSAGIDATVTGTIPINAGTSSSSALVVSWVSVLAFLSDQARMVTPEEAARYAHEAEVLEFGEPGGMMDHYATALGGVLALEFIPHVRWERLGVEPGAFVLGNSGEPKDTKGILSRVKNRVVRCVEVLERHHPGFSLHTATSGTIEDLAAELTAEESALLLATIRNRQLTHEAKALLCTSPLDHKAFGALLDEHHAVLRDTLDISTPKIDRMLRAARAAGASGGKINGSGGGGCMFAYAPENAAGVALAVEDAGGQAWVVHMSEGVEWESMEG